MKTWHLHFDVQAFSIVALAEQAREDVKQRVEDLLKQHGCETLDQLLGNHPEATSPLAGRC
jgi:hypothetical protein